MELSDPLATSTAPPDESETVACALCGANESTIAINCFDRAHGCPGRFLIVKCRRCGLMYLNPRPSPDAIWKFYPSEDYQCYTPFRVTLGTRLKRWALWPLYAGGIGVFSRALRAVFRVVFRGHFGGSPRFRTSGRAIDVGCGNGQFVAFLGVFGSFESSGLEPSERMVDYARARGLDVRRGFVNEEDLPESTYDVIRLWHVFEHLHDPPAALAALRRSLTENGELIIGVPDIGSPAARVFGSRWQGLEAPRHLYHYSRPTLTRLLEDNGFEVKQVLSIGGRSIVGSLIYLGHDLAGWLLGRPVTGAAPRLTRVLVTLMLPVELAMGRLGIGDSIEIHAVKKRADSAG